MPFKQKLLAAAVAASYLGTALPSLADSTLEEVVVTARKAN